MVVNRNVISNRKWRKIIKRFQKPFDEYLRCNAKVFVGKQPVEKNMFKCFLWFPKNIAEEPHLYFLIEDSREYQHFENLAKDALRIINVKIEIYFLGETENPHQIHMLKNLYFSESNGTFIAENWFEGFFKYHFPKYALSKTFVNINQQNETITFYITESKLLTSKISTVKHFSGEVKREIISQIVFEEKELSQFGIFSISTDKYIGDNASYIIEILPLQPVNSIVTFYNKIKPIIDILLLFTSFAERRRLNWYKCEGSINEKSVDLYNTRTAFFNDKRRSFLISQFVFEDYIKQCLSNMNDRVSYLTNLLRSYFSGIDYSVNAKIILWNSILERILKKNFNKKKDNLKENLINEMGIYISDLPPIQKLIDIRNASAHGDDEDFSELFQLSFKWQILIERILLKELKWDDLSKTDVNINGRKPMGL